MSIVTDFKNFAATGLSSGAGFVLAGGVGTIVETSTGQGSPIVSTGINLLAKFGFYELIEKFDAKGRLGKNFSEGIATNAFVTLASRFLGSSLTIGGINILQMAEDDISGRTVGMVPGNANQFVQARKQTFQSMPYGPYDYTQRRKVYGAMDSLPFMQHQYPAIQRRQTSFSSMPTSNVRPGVEARDRQFQAMGEVERRHVFGMNIPS